LLEQQPFPQSLKKKKQRYKEEEQLLDEEGAALAEAVALQADTTNGS
jgi:hypothetical protein